MADAWLSTYVEVDLIRVTCCMLEGEGRAGKGRGVRRSKFAP